VTEQEWMTATNSTFMGELLYGKVSNRKLRLCAVACCRRVWNQMTEPSRKAVEAAERYADNRADRRTMGEARRKVRAEMMAIMAEERELNAYKRLQQGTRRLLVLMGWNVTSWKNRVAVAQCSLKGRAVFPSIPPILFRSLNARRATAKGESLCRREYGKCLRVQDGIQCKFFHCIFGNPFRPVAFDPTWLTSTVLALATGIYAEHAFDRMPILADALQDAGCENADILNHCRQPGDHVRGCWVVDLLLGKA
jgi:hypothetical protein